MNWNHEKEALFQEIQDRFKACFKPCGTDPLVLGLGAKSYGANQGQAWLSITNGCCQFRQKNSVTFVCDCDFIVIFIIKKGLFKAIFGQFVRSRGIL